MDRAALASVRSHPRFDEAYRAYVLENWGLPDLYFEPLAEYEYAMLSRQPELRAHYDAFQVGELPLYVLRTSPRHDQIVERLRPLAGASGEVSSGSLAGGHALGYSRPGPEEAAP
ncbi:MAG: hypothetical protein ACREAA_17775 [Candidatus Polarisedimenticolia bacterium]